MCVPTYVHMYMYMYIYMGCAMNGVIMINAHEIAVCTYHMHSDTWLDHNL